MAGDNLCHIRGQVSSSSMSGVRW